MNIFQKLTDTIRETINIDTHIDTDAAEKSIRGNIEFRGPNAWILAVAIIIASVGLNVNSIPVIIGAMLISPLIIFINSGSSSKEVDLNNFPNFVSR